MQNNFYRYRWPLFWETIDIILDLTNQPPRPTEDVSHIYEYALQLQRIFNMFDPESELSRLNAHRHRIISDDLLELIKIGIERSKKTHGAYDITLGKQIVARKQHLPIPSIHCSVNDIIINGNEVSLIHPDVLIDLGSIAKWYITDQLVTMFRYHGWQNGLIDARGDIVAFGSYAEELGIQNPRNPDQELGHFTLYQAAVATSWDYLQYDTSFDLSHIIHQGKYNSITVIAPTLMQADLLATVLFVCDDRCKNMIMTTIPEIMACFCTTEMQVELFPKNHSFVVY